MKKTIKLALSASLLLGATSAFATNGDLMIGQGAQSRGMGGVGIAKSFGAQSALANPAMLNSVKNMEFTGAVTFFTPSVSFASDAYTRVNDVFTSAATPTAAPKAQDSAVGTSYIPEIYFAQRVNKNLVYGVSVTGVAGMGTDYKKLAGTAKDNGAFGMTTALSIAKIAIPVAYSTSGFTLGLAPVLQYGTLQMNYTKQSQGGVYSRSINPKSSSTGFGYEIGLSYDMKNAGVEGLTLAAVYKSKIAMTYKKNIASAVTDFGVTSVKSGDKLDQPAEIGLGLAYAISGNTIAVDYKNIQWSSAAGYGDFGWKDQNTVAVGYEYAASSWAFRTGFNYGKSPISQQANAQGNFASYDKGAINFFNLSGFPGVVNEHFTIGGGYNISGALSLNAAVVYAPKVTVSYSTSGMSAGMVAKNPQGGTVAAAGTAASTANVTHSQMGLTIAATYKF